MAAQPLAELPLRPARAPRGEARLAERRELGRFGSYWKKHEYPLLLATAVGSGVIVPHLDAYLTMRPFGPKVQPSMMAMAASLVGAGVLHWYGKRRPGNRLKRRLIVRALCAAGTGIGVTITQRAIRTRSLEATSGVEEAEATPEP
jgi:hypothetical protein